MELNGPFQSISDTLLKRTAQKGRDLSIIKKLLKEVGNPEGTFPTIHVAGTNGKGQTCAKIARALELGGYKVGLYISPHITSVDERISINGKTIPKEIFISYFHELETLIAKHSLDPIFFDCLTWMGFCYFAKQKVDIAIIEVGLGGRLDQTNVITPQLSIITSIGLDHQDYLGDTLEKIALEKAGVIKPRVPVLLGPRANFSVFFEKAKENKAPIHSIGEKSCLYEEENRFIAIKALELLSLQFPLCDAAIEEGVKANLPCRLEIRGKGIFDAAHNPPAFTRLKEALTHLFPNETFHFVVGFNRNKDAKGCLKEIEPLAKHFHFVSCDHPESLTGKELKEMLTSFSSCSFTIEKTIFSGVENAQAAAKNHFVICGSFYIMDQAKSVCLEGMTPDCHLSLGFGQRT